MNTDTTIQSSSDKLKHITPSPFGGGDRGEAPLGELKHINPSPIGGGAARQSLAGWGCRSALALSRAPRFSPNNVDNDLLILQAVAERVGEKLGIEVPIIGEEEFCANPVDADLYLSMGRLPMTLDILTEKEREGRIVVNSTAGVRLCSHRSLLDRMMRQWDISMPPIRGNEGYWLKRGDSVTQTEDDVVFCENIEEQKAAIENFNSRGINEVVKSAHISGEQIKFYGVGDQMFRYFYTDDGSEGLDKQQSADAALCHSPFNIQALRSEVIRLSHLTHVDIYGGDAIVDKNGNYFIIDFNDWPTFRNCREETAEEIINYLGYGNI